MARLMTTRAKSKFRLNCKMSTPSKRHSSLSFSADALRLWPRASVFCFVRWHCTIEYKRVVTTPENGLAVIHWTRKVFCELAGDKNFEFTEGSEREPVELTRRKLWHFLLHFGVSLVKYGSLAKQKKGLGAIIYCVQ